MKRGMSRLNSFSEHATSPWTMVDVGKRSKVTKSYQVTKRFRVKNMKNMAETHQKSIKNPSKIHGQVSLVMYKKNCHEAIGRNPVSFPRTSHEISAAP
jgi:hypothetical protein